ncbi:MAG: carotenoid oxygenase family protein [Scytolyngbya sp. HA4215-MV1]|nr:carotenoid oxygenase family protein [Scytolyngbya sp. HA4215-MV1]
MLRVRSSESTAESVSLPYNVKQWQKGYESLSEEFDYWIEEIEGTIPPDLQGTLFRNGPGRLEVNGARFHHPFDGDGMVCAIAFSKGRAHFRNRFVRTSGFVEEQRENRILYRGVFGTQKPGGLLANAFDFRLKNIANTNVLYWGGKLLALWEAAVPHRLDPGTLETLGLEYFEGALDAGSAFAAHPWIDPSSAQDGGAPCLVNFSIKPGLSTTITLYELNSQGAIVRQSAHRTPGFAFIHDFAITPNYGIFFQNPVVFNPLPYALGLKGAGECIRFQPDQSTRIIVVPRQIGNPAQDYQAAQFLEAQSGFVFHHANAFEQDGLLYVDSVCYENLPALKAGADYRETDFSTLAPGQLWRFQLDLKTSRVERQRLESRCCEFPFVHPDRVGRSYRYLFMGAAHEATGNAPLQAILKADLVSGDRQLWSAAPWGYVSEPVFVPRSASADRRGLPTADLEGDEDEGWLLTLVFDGTRQRSDVVILDARNIQQGPIARLHLKHHIPYGLHGSFTPEVFN